MEYRPYVSSRSGRWQWGAQRVSALLLIGLAFFHFAQQHFTTAAVSTGLSVSARFNDPWWQAYYIVFVVLAVYHGVNGLIGIAWDYAPRPLARGVIATVLWTAAAAITALGIANIVAPRPLGEVKEHYALHGFSAGESRGSPGLAPARRYDFRAEAAELPLLRHYLMEHTATDGPVDAVAFGVAEITRDNLPQASASFDRWLLEQIAQGRPLDVEETRAIFSTAYEYAVWAANVRRANALHRLQDEETDAETKAAARAILDRLPPQRVPRYEAGIH